jgi:hypothetical protein
MKFDEPSYLYIFFIFLDLESKTLLFSAHLDPQKGGRTFPINSLTHSQVTSKV